MYELLRFIDEEHAEKLYGSKVGGGIKPMLFKSKNKAMNWIHERIAYCCHTDKCNISKPKPIKWNKNYWLYQVTENDIYHIYKVE